MASGRVFVTVGSTKFDSLISAITRVDTLRALKRKGFHRVECQIGKGAPPPSADGGSVEGIQLKWFDFDSSLERHIADADFVIGHGGAGTCIEVLARGKPLLVVVNEELMDNHQNELAQQLSAEGYLYFCTVSDLLRTIESIDLSKLKQFPECDPNLFPKYLDTFMGFR